MFTAVDDLKNKKKTEMDSFVLHFSLKHLKRLLNGKFTKRNKILNLTVCRQEIKET